MVLYGALDKAPFKAPAEGGEGEEGMKRRGSGAGAAGGSAEGRAGCGGSQGERSDKPWGGESLFFVFLHYFCDFLFLFVQLFFILSIFHFGR